MRAPPFVVNALHFGIRAYDHARHGLAGLNRAVETGARLYGGIIQPLLHANNIDTRSADTALMGAYDSYDAARTVTSKIDRLIQS